MKGKEIVRACDRHSNETVTLRKHVTKYKNMRKYIPEFLIKSESRGGEIAGVDSIFSLILYGVGVRCEVDVFKLTAHA